MVKGLPSSCGLHGTGPVSFPVNVISYSCLIFYIEFTVVATATTIACAITIQSVFKIECICVT